MYFEGQVVFVFIWVDYIGFIGQGRVFEVNVRVVDVLVF